MKRCKQCGNLYSDEKSICLECGERLPAPMSEAEIAAAEEAARKKREELKKKFTEHHVGKGEKITGILSFIFAVISVAMTVLFFINSNNEPGMLCLAVGLAFVIAAVTFLFPVKLWEINARRAVEKDNEKIYPPAGYFTINKIVAYTLFGVGVLVLALQLLRLILIMTE